MRTLLLIFSVFPSLVHAAPACSDIDDCYGCAKSCHWCHRDNQCHNPTWVNFIDPCWVHGDDTSSTDQCDAKPIPTPDEWSWNHCAYEWGVHNQCQCNGQVRFGKDLTSEGGVASWTTPITVDGSIFCEISWFHHDPFPLVAKECQCLQAANAATPPTNNTFASGVLHFIFKKLGITDVKLDECIADVGDSELRFRDFAVDLKNKKYQNAFHELGRGISGLANSVTTCGVQEVKQKIDALASAVKWANISTSTFDHDIKVIVGATDLWKDLEALQAAVESKDPSSVGNTLSTLLDDWTSIEGGCKVGETVCQVVDGLLHVLAATAKEVAPCEEALKPAVMDLTEASRLFMAKSYKNATIKFAAGLDVMAKATISDACGLKHVADAIGNLSPKLAAAIVNISSSSEVRIIIGSANVYDELYTLAQDFEKKDYTGVGVQLGLLLAKLKSSSCQTEMCIVVEGLLGSLQLGFTDLEECSADLDKTWTKMQALVTSLGSKNWTQSLLALGDVLKDLGDDINACGLPSLGSILQDTASKLHADSLATDIGLAVHFLVEGADITPDIQKIIVDSDNKQWGALGSDLGTLSTWITSTGGCHSFSCKLMEGLLEEAGVALTDLKPCEDKLREAEKDFINGANLWGQNQHKNALNYWAAGLNVLAQSVDACGLPQQLKYIQQEANVLGLANITGIGSAVSILVHGSDLAEEISGAWLAFVKQDYRTAGSEFQKAVFGLYQWTTGHLCDSDACYVFNGILQYVSDLAKDMKKCEGDLKGMMDEFVAAFDQLSSSKDVNGTKGFTRNMTAIEAGMGDIGKGMDNLANTVGDCHLEELATLLAALAQKLHIMPNIAVVEEVLKILINGVAVEREVANALEDFGAKNWPGFGYALIKLVKTLLKSEASSQSAFVI